MVKINNTILLLVIILLFGCGSNTPPEEDKNPPKAGENSISVNGACSYYGDVTTDNFNGFNSDNKAQAAITKIMEHTGLSANFKLMAADVEDVCAVISEDNQRYILYNQDFMLSVENLTNTHWAETSMLAHEIGHHLSGHTFSQEENRTDSELEADRFSGFILYKMGASLEEAQAAISKFSTEENSSTHPSKKSRLAAITNGWLSAKEQNVSIDDNLPPSESGGNGNNSFESTESSVKEQIINILNQYYQYNDNSQCSELAQFYLPVVDNFYNKINQTTSQIVDECVTYHSRWPIQNIEIDNSTFAITPLNNGDYFVTYDMFYQIKKTAEDDWKNYNLTINVRFSSELKIRSMYEYKK